ncbi:MULTISPECIES: hypothetical protein [unclassified Actinopolyspora]|uniref:hypothetical protein n=1 Tax=unclassified Actinopolyspora TaxID=2639451 RepID=UPI0013F67241|nr:MULTISPECIES: hypothetical protein [unclassified Actinopolyspora]NHD19311.1 hypothetical protein [Actinopolyspora sp. BKK2]NHE78435.1 hypothetical protein [Actinopolyspora sp. BKK1]
MVIDTLVVRIRARQFTNRSVGTVNGERDILGTGAGQDGEGAKFWLHAPTQSSQTVVRRMGAWTGDAPGPPNHYQRDQSGSLLHPDVEKLVRCTTPGNRPPEIDATGKVPDPDGGYFHVVTGGATRLLCREGFNTGEIGQADTGFPRRALT